MPLEHTPPLGFLSESARQLADELGQGHRERAPLHARVVARFIDFLLSANLVSFIATLLAPSFFAAGFSADGQSAAGRYVFFALPCVLVLDALWPALFGNSLGRLLTGIRLRRVNGQSVDFPCMMRRAISMYVWGFALGIAGLDLLAPLIAVWRTRGGRREAQWDLAAGTRSVGEGASVPRSSAVLAGLATLLATFAYWRASA